MTAQLSRERIEQYANDPRMCNVNEEIRTMARMLLAGMDSEPYWWAIENRHGDARFVEGEHTKNDIWDEVHELNEKDGAGEYFDSDAPYTVVPVYRHTAPPAPVTLTVSKDEIRKIFIRNGFTIKDGQIDLKDYVYDAAFELISSLKLPAPVAVPDDLIAELLEIAKNAADEADECGRVEHNDDSDQHTKAIAEWEIRFAQRAIEPNPAPLAVQCPFPCGWNNLNKLAIQNAAFVARGLVEDELVTEAHRQAVFANNDRLLKVIAACRATMLKAGPVTAATEPEKCWCRTCRPVDITDMRFVVCPDCGNKRCPKANDHRNACSGSNEPGQAGSAYPAAPVVGGFRENAETSTKRSREHFISLCNQFWNWQEFDEINAGDEEPRLEWNGKEFTHRVTQALWRMYQAAPEQEV